MTKSDSVSALQPVGTRTGTTKTRLLLFCGLFSSLFYVATDLLASWWYPGYSAADQNYSELLATGAPTRPFLLIVAVFYNLLVAAFGSGIWRAASPRRTAHITGVMMILYAIVSMVTPAIFQMDMRGAEITPLGSLHPHMTALMSLFILLSIGFGGFLLGKGFRYYSLATIVVLMVFGFLTSAQVPQMVAGQPTPWMGFTERINIYATMLWFALLSLALARSEKKEPVTIGSSI
jgi:hypothetical protein